VDCFSEVASWGIGKIPEAQSEERGLPKPITNTKNLKTKPI